NAFLFGAGSSCGTVGAPVDAQFGPSLESYFSSWRTQYPAIASIANHLGYRDSNDFTLCALWSCMDNYAKFCEALDPTPWPDAARQLKTVLLKIYGRRCDLLADKLPLDDSYTLGRIFRTEVKPGDALISFNYDCIVERLAKRCGLVLTMNDQKADNSI